jgi:hypothetical protein
MLAATDPSLRLPYGAETDPVDVTFVMPCLNELQALPACLEMIADAARTLSERHGLTTEVIVADNGSTDGSQTWRARLAHGSKRCTSALRGGAARRFPRRPRPLPGDGRRRRLVQLPRGRADDRGADGRRRPLHGLALQGRIGPGAMPWKNRYIGNPILTGVLNLLFGAGIQDAHCGLRALTRACFRRLNLSGSGMEFASEMVIKAALTRQVIVETPATLSPDLRDRPPHLRPWRDGWRHLRFLFMLSPSRLFGVPALLAGPDGNRDPGQRRLGLGGQRRPALLLRQLLGGPGRGDGRRQPPGDHIDRRHPPLWRGRRLPASQPRGDLPVALGKPRDHDRRGVACGASGLSILVAVLLGWRARDFGQPTASCPPCSERCW